MVQLEDYISFLIGFTIATVIGSKREYDLKIPFSYRSQFELTIFALTGGFSAILLRRALESRQSK